MPADLDAIRARITPADLLREAGHEVPERDGWAPLKCPFHPDNKASAGVSPLGFRCHGCGVSGDVFKLWMLLHPGATFLEALRALAERAGVALDGMDLDKLRRDREVRQRREDLRATAADFYRRALIARPEHLGFLSDRWAVRDPAAAAERWGVGLAEGAGLRSALQKAGSPPEEIAACGLFKDGRELFRNRIVFPYYVHGVAEGFAARALRADDRPKWLFGYGPRPLFYGLDHVPARSRVIRLAEGVGDAIRLDEEGVPAIAGMQVAGDREEEAKRLLAPFETLEVVPDSDRPKEDGRRPGREEALRFIKTALGWGKRVSVRPLPEAPEGQDSLDPADFLRGKTRADFETLPAVPPWLYVLDGRKDADATRLALDVVALIPDGLRREDAAREVARATGRRLPDVRDALKERLPGPKREEPAPEVTLQGQGLVFRDPDPWPEAVDGAALLDEIAGTFRRYLALAPGTAETFALWSVFSHALDYFSINPRLGITSPCMRSGKTTALELLAGLVRRPLPNSGATPAAIYRAIESFQPTLLLDELDTYLDEKKELVGILNSGHTRTTAFRLVTVGEDHEPRTFSTWAPMVFARIGRLPATLADRSVPIPMRRRAPGEKVERLRRDRIGQGLEPLRQKAARWVRDHAAALREADPEVPEELGDRAADNWRVLLALADVAGGDWPLLARDAALKLSAGTAADADDDKGERLLTDLRDIFDRLQADGLPTARLIMGKDGDGKDVPGELLKLEEAPWATWNRGRPISPHQLARLLASFGISPTSVRIPGAGTLKGYRRADLEDAWARYRPPGSGTSGTSKGGKDLQQISIRNKPPHVPDAFRTQTLAAQGMFRCSGSGGGDSVPASAASPPEPPDAPEPAEEEPVPLADADTSEVFP